MQSNSLDNIPTGGVSAGPASANSALPNPSAGLQIAPLEPFKPLDAQFAADPPKTAPDPIFDELFGQPARDTTPKDAPPLNTFAILDAAKVTNLPELLQTSGLEHHCLFKGDAFDELSHVAPWIVQLEPDNRFSRNLFTEGRAPWQLWDKSPGCFLRARATCEEIRKHFRKILRVQDDTGKWYFFRFWEGTALQTVAATADLQGQQRLYHPTMAVYARQSTPDGDMLIKSWVNAGPEAPTS